MALIANIVGPIVVLGGLLVILFGRARAIEGYLAGLAAIAVAVLLVALSSPYSSEVGAGMSFGFGLLVISGMALLMHRLVVPAE